MEEITFFECRVIAIILFCGFHADAKSRQIMFDNFYLVVINLFDYFYPECTITITSQYPECNTPELKSKLR